MALMSQSRGTAATVLLLVVATSLTGCLSSRRYRPGAVGCKSGCGTGAISKGDGMMMPSLAPRVLPPDIKRAAYFQDGYAGPEIKDKDKGPMMSGPAHPVEGIAPFGPCPTEVNKVSHPPYTVAPPDILVIDAVRLVPKAPYRVEPLEILLINVANTLPGEPISGPFVVGPEGTVNLGFKYGSVRVVGQTLEQIQKIIEKHLRAGILDNPVVTVALAQFRGLQQVRGQHLVRQDGTISLGMYGAVYVAGYTLGQVKCVIEKHLSAYLQDPQISVDVFAYNSKFYYVILDRPGAGQAVIRIPITGNETVLDAIALVNGTAPESSRKRIWLARPSPAFHGCNQILPVDWQAIIQGGSTTTNYQIFPGDRVYVQSDRLTRLDANLAKLLAPIERVLGVTLLGVSVADSFATFGEGDGSAILVQ